MPSDTGPGAVEDPFTRRSRLTEHYAVVPLAFSIDGRRVEFVGPLDFGAAVGGIVVVDHDDGALAVHVHDLALRARHASMDVESGRDDVTVGFTLRHVGGDGVVVGRLTDEGFESRTRGSSSNVPLCVDVSDLTTDVQAAILRLDPIADLDDYAALRSVTERLAEPYSIVDVARLAAQDRGAWPAPTNGRRSRWRCSAPGGGCATPAAPSCSPSTRPTTCCRRRPPIPSSGGRRRPGS